MWLAEDERRLLSGYYNLIEQIDDTRVFEIKELAKILPSRKGWKNVKKYGDPSTDKAGSPKSIDTSKREIKSLPKLMSRITSANKTLSARNLLQIKPHQHEMDVICVSLTVEGYDLGRKYTGFWIRSGLWFREYKDHWLILIIAFLAGVLGSLVVAWLSKAS